MSLLKHCYTNILLLAGFLLCTVHLSKDTGKKLQNAHAVGRLSEDFLQAALAGQKNATTKAKYSNILVKLKKSLIPDIKNRAGSAERHYCDNLKCMTAVLLTLCLEIWT
jgi:hypothetical protein